MRTANWTHVKSKPPKSERVRWTENKEIKFLLHLLPPSLSPRIPLHNCDSALLYDLIYRNCSSSIPSGAMYIVYTWRSASLLRPSSFRIRRNKRDSLRRGERRKICPTQLLWLSFSLPFDYAHYDLHRSSGLWGGIWSAPATHSTSKRGESYRERETLITLCPVDDDNDNGRKGLISISDVIILDSKCFPLSAPQYHHHHHRASSTPLNPIQACLQPSSIPSYYHFFFSLYEIDPRLD